MLIKIMTFDKAPEKRRENAEKLAFLLKAQVYVGGTDTLDNFIGICKSVGKDDLLYLEDDIQICSNFLTRIKKAIEAFPDKMISFFSCDLQDCKVREVPYTWHKFSQCLYIPNKVVKQLLKVAPQFREKKYRDNDWERIFCELKGTYIRYFPHLVQQHEWESTIFDIIDPRSPFYVGESNEYDNTI